jgi:cobalt-zinc-cadmium efflux system outer membrane protein
LLRVVMDGRSRVKANILFGLAVALALGLNAAAGQAAEAGSSAAPDLTSEHAVAKALEQHPELVAVTAEIDGKEGAALQAGLLPNPEFEVEVEEIGADEGTDVLETTFSLSQDVELGGKRRKRRDAASLEISLARWDLDTKHLDVVEAVNAAFVEALAAQDRVRLQEELVGVAEKGLAAVTERVKAGKVSPIEETQARVTLASSRIELSRARSEWEGARGNLAAAWGGSGDEVVGVEGSLTEIRPLPSESELLEALQRNPDLARWDAEIEQRKAAVVVESAGRIPDLTLTGGVRTFGGTDDVTYVAAISMPLPLFGRNQGAIIEADQELARTRAEQRAVRREVRADLSGEYQKLVAARAEIEALEEAVLPDAEAAFEAIREGYRWGKFEYLDLLDAQRTLVQAKAQAVDARAAYHAARARLERLTAAHRAETTN